jgi:hypothetical protein
VILSILQLLKLTRSGSLPRPLKATQLDERSIIQNE